MTNKSKYIYVLARLSGQFPAKESLPYPVYVQKLGSEFWNPGKSLVTLEVTLTLRQVTRNIPGILLVDKTTLEFATRVATNDAIAAFRLAATAPPPTSVAAT
ncbi:hypothetical protein HZH66_009657 [Vespula vulgaris]|uniref:Uncharacterized protein n=1 Tax=Vespula vulgaris TaxID=7454 RepID=A0A834JN56_VESVU|nr:hypothetical protein HZH66_009657 [Vespula vulgaris]